LSGFDGFIGGEKEIEVFLCLFRNWLGYCPSLAPGSQVLAAFNNSLARVFTRSGQHLSQFLKKVNQDFNY
jgi:hypothetical protein